MENPIKMDDLGGKTHYFRKHTYFSFSFSDLGVRIKFLQHVFFSCFFQNCLLKLLQSFLILLSHLPAVWMLAPFFGGQLSRVELTGLFEKVL